MKQFLQKDRLSFFLIFYFLLSLFFFPIASQLQFGKLQIVPPEALYTSIKLFDSYETAMFVYGIRSVVGIFLYFCIFLAFYSKYRSGKFELTVFQKSLILLILVANTITPPFSSNDFYYYMGLGRIQAYQNVNPYLVPISKTPLPEITASIGVWVDIPTMYAPFLTYFYKVVASVSNNLILHGFLLKFLALFAYLVSGYMSFKIANIYSAKIGGLVVFAFLLNPLSLDEILINGHNDIFAILFFLGAVYLGLTARYILASGLFFMTVFIKFPFLALAPLFLFLPKRNDDEEENTFLKRLIIGAKITLMNGLRFMLPGFLIVIPFLFFFYFQYFNDPSSLKAFGILGALWNSSTPGVLGLMLNEYANVSIGKVLKLIVFLRFSFFIFVFYRAFKIKNKNIFLEEITFVLILFYLVFSAYVWSWYLVIIVPFAFFRPNRTYIFHILAIAFGASCFWIFFHLNAGGIFGFSLFHTKLLEYLLSYSIVIILFSFSVIDKRLHDIFSI
nr:hypothetical protein [Leptospiraceae bacterium]